MGVIFRCLLIVAIFFFITQAYPIFLSKTDGKILHSPLPDLLTNTFRTSGYASSWNPDIALDKSGKFAPSVTAHSVLIYDLTSSKTLYQKEINKRLPIASLTKIMTAIIALENDDLSRKIMVSKKAAEIGENSMGLSEGEILKTEDLLYGLILVSGNDAAETLVEKSRFGRENFIYLMNKKAEDIGLSDTHFTNPTGLEGDGSQYSTSRDLLILTKYALENPSFSKIVSTVTHEISADSKHKAYGLINETNLLTSYPGVRGVKTGFTNEAGLCLVTYLEYEDHKIIGIILNSQSRREEMRELLDYSLKTLGVKPPPHP